MARTIQEIEAEIIAAKEDDVVLNTLTSSSNTAVWRRWVKVFAFIINIFEKFQDVFKSEVQAIINSRRIGTLAWYVSAAKDFQIGDDLVEFVAGDYGYNAIDETKQIISRASAKVEGGVIKLKVAKEGDEGAVALSLQELLQFRSYVELIKFAGTAIEYISLNADTLSIVCDVFYNGVYATVDIQNAIQDKVNEFLAQIPFDGVLNKNSFIDAIRDVDGVSDIVFTAIEATQGAVTVAIGREYETVAGYINLSSLVVSNFVVDAI